MTSRKNMAPEKITIDKLIKKVKICAIFLVKMPQSRRISTKHISNGTSTFTKQSNLFLGLSNESTVIKIRKKKN